MKQQTIFGEEIDVAVPTPASTRRWTRPPDYNPCVAFYGAGPAGKRCKECAHLVMWLDHGNGRIYKCDLRKNTSGAATDHRVNWPACARWQAVTP